MVHSWIFPIHTQAQQRQPQTVDQFVATNRLPRASHNQHLTLTQTIYPNYSQIYSLPDTQFKTIVIRMIKELHGRINNINENLTKVIANIKKDIETIKKNQSEMKNRVSEMKNKFKGINSRLNEVEY